jgi:syntaxin-binding protein 5
MIQRITYGTLFAQRRSYYRLPRVDLIAKGQSIPPAPVPVSMGPGSLMGTLMGYVSGPRIMTGEDIDAICK